MSFIRKILDAFKLESTREMEKNLENDAINGKAGNKNNDYYARIAQQKENNLQITYNDVECYNLRPFGLNKPFLSDGHFTAIALEGDNLKKSYCYLQEVHNILFPFKHLFKNASFPEIIGTDYAFRDAENNLPVSHLRLSPYTATMKKNKYPFWLWLSYFGDYGTEYIYTIYFNQQGEIGKCDLSLHGSNGARLSYESKIRRNENGLYVMRINKTLYVEPYGTKIIYHYQDDKDFLNTQRLSLKGNIGNEKEGCKELEEKQSAKKKSMPRRQTYTGQYDLERFAIECNAYVVREERLKQEVKDIEENKEK